MILENSTPGKLTEVLKCRDDMKLIGRVYKQTLDNVALSWGITLQPNPLR